MKGKNVKMFLGDQEIIGCDSFSFGERLEGFESITFTGTFDPEDKGVDEYINKATGKIITGTVYGIGGEKKEMRLKAEFVDGEIVLEPIDEEDHEWAKLHIFKEQHHE